MHACADLARRSVLRPILGQTDLLPGIARRIDVCNVVSRHRNTLLCGEQCRFADVDQSINSHLFLYQTAAAGCSKSPSSKAAASEDRRRTLWGARCDE